MIIGGFLFLVVKLLITFTVNQKETIDFQQFLMTAPTWSDNEYENYVENRKFFSQCRKAIKERQQDD